MGEGSLPPFGGLLFEFRNSGVMSLGIDIPCKVRMERYPKMLLRFGVGFSFFGGGWG